MLGIITGINRTRLYKTLALLSISALSLFVAFRLLDFAILMEVLRTAKLDALGVSAAMIFLGMGVSLLRFRSVLGALGHGNVAAKDLFVAFTVGQASSLILFNVVGQSLSRAAMLASKGVPFGVTVMATYWERLLAAAILLALVLAGAVVIALDIGIDLEGGGGYLLSLLVGIGVVGSVAGIVAFNGAGIDKSVGMIVRGSVRFLPGVVLTLTAHGFMLLAYV